MALREKSKSRYRLASAGIIILAIIQLFFAIPFWRDIPYLIRKDFSHIEGKVTKIEGFGKPQKYKISVEDMELTGIPRIKLMENSEKYKFAFLPHSHSIVNIEYSR